MRASSRAVGATPDETAQVVSNCSVHTVVIAGVPERGPVHAPLRRASSQTSICSDLDLLSAGPDTCGTALLLTLDIAELRQPCTADAASRSDETSVTPAGRV